MSDESNILESKIEFPSQLSNSVVIPQENGPDALYVGWFYSLYPEGNDVRGGASLARYDRRTYQGVRRRFNIHFKPFEIGIKTEKVEKHKDSLVWCLNTKGYYDYMISSGETCSGYKSNANYRGDLLSRGLRNGIIVSTEVYDKVFGPMDKKLLDFMKSIFAKYPEVKK